nr:GNAT family N-acetyltransferase [Novosphingobium piscinae]
MIVGIQRGEFGIAITAEDQPDLANIPDFYQRGGGGFWVAEAGGLVVGTIALKDFGGGQAALRKMFVAPAARGRAAGTAAALLATLLGHARAHGLTDIYLGTIERLHAAHRFYAKHGFAPIAAETLPAQFPRMAVDTHFYHHALPGRSAGN